MSHLLPTSILAIIIAQSAIHIAVLLRSKRCNHQGNLIMSLFIVCCVLFAFDCYINFTGLYRQFPYFIRVITPLYYMYGILPYFYARALTEKEFQFKFRCWPHLTLLVITIILFIPVYTSSPDDKIRYIVENQDFIKRKIIMLFIFLSNSVYLILGYQKLKKYHKKIKNFYSNLQALKFEWYESLFVALISVHFFVVTFSLVFANQNFNIVYHIFFYGLAAITVFSGYTAISQLDPLSILVHTDKKTSTESKSIISDSLKVEIKEAINKLMTEGKVYLQADLNLDGLSKQLGHPSYAVSNVINSEFNMNFFELINSNRIKESAVRLKDPKYKNLTILAIAEDVGFNSKSTFNTAFKKHFGITPSKFRSTDS